MLCRGHLTRQITFSGKVREGPNKEEDGDNIPLSKLNSLGLPIYQKKRHFQLGTRSQDDRELPYKNNIQKIKDQADAHGRAYRVYNVGGTCAKRLLLYHALYHFRYHAMIFLKRKLKLAIKEFKVRYILFLSGC